MKLNKFAKNIIGFIILFLISDNIFSQSLYVGDNMEYPPAWRGISTPGTNSTFIGGLSSSIDNAPNYPMYASSDSCYVIKGTGLGSSAIEVDTFTYPIIPLTSGRRYQIRYKLASFGLNYSVQTAAGVDQTDNIEMQYTVNNGLSWWRDAQIQGISNSMWTFDGAIGTNAKLNITRTGSMSTTTPMVYASNALNPIVNVWVTLPTSNFTTLRIRFITNINASGETWMLDDVEIWDITPTLPIELIEFNGTFENNKIRLYWETASETNNDYFEIYKSTDGINYFLVNYVWGNGTTNQICNYEYFDLDYCDDMVYYKLKQVDYDGNYKEYDPILVRCKIQNKKIIKIVNQLGQEVNENYNGLKFYIYEK